IIRGGPSQLVPEEDLLLAKGVDPVVMLGQLGEQLTGIGFLEIGGGARTWIPTPAGVVVLEEADGASFTPEYPVEASVEEIKDALRDALAAIEPADVPAIAERWAGIEEMSGATGPDIEWFVTDLSVLARRAVATGRHLYCWWSL
ncbi:MAG TPA: hypothetical protein VGF17_20215, partial [Phytomonospora sp.]